VCIVARGDRLRALHKRKAVSLVMVKVQAARGLEGLLLCSLSRKPMVADEVVYREVYSRPVLV
jgi:hypothetical protein